MWSAANRLDLDPLIGRIEDVSGGGSPVSITGTRLSVIASIPGVPNSFR